MASFCFVMLLPPFSVATGYIAEKVLACNSFVTLCNEQNYKQSIMVPHFCKTDYWGAKL